MSHFSVMVVTKRVEDIEKVLQPYHEFECTGIRDEYVVFVDKHDEIVKEYNEKKDTRWVNLETGEIAHPFSEQFYRDATPEEEEMIKNGNKRDLIIRSDGILNDRTYKVKCATPPEGWEEQEVGVDKEYGSIDKFAEEWHGCELVDGRWGRYTNPNAKWDWWTVGGRWSNHIRMKEAPLLTDGSLFTTMGFSHAEIANFVAMYKEDPVKVAQLCDKYKGKGGDLYAAIVNASTPVYRVGIDDDNSKPGYADCAYKKDIDFLQMEKEAVQEAEKRFDTMYSIIQTLVDNGAPRPEKWITLLRRYENTEGGIEKAREIYGAQPIVEALRKHPGHDYSWDCPVKQFFLDEEDSRKKYIERRRCSAFTTFAVVKDGKWFARGEMGWWAIVSNESLEYDWDAKFSELIESLDDDDIITIVDCHI